MPYADVPQRLLDGEAVPRSEIIGYGAPLTDLQIDMVLNLMYQWFVLEKVYEGETLKYQITTFGTALRRDYVKRIDGDCPGCPECP